MQAIYTVLASPKVSDSSVTAEGLKFVPNNFSWGAFLVPLIWLPIHRMWLTLFFYCAIILLIILNILIFFLGDYRTEILQFGVYVMAFSYLLALTINNSSIRNLLFGLLIIPLLLLFAYIILLTYSTNFRENIAFEGFAIDMSVWFIGAILGMICFAQIANELRIGLLEKKGWRIVDSILASSSDEAEFRYFSERQTRFNNKSSNDRGYGNQTEQENKFEFDDDFSSENRVVGLFPKPENS